MPRRNRGKQPKRHPNGRQRPRSWHHGTAAGREQLAKLDAVTPAFVAAEVDVAESAARSRASRAAQADWEALLGQLERVAPIARAPLRDPLFV